MEEVIAANPSAAPLIQGTGGVRKLRWAASGRCKRGGVRTVYLHQTNPEAINSLMAHAKADREDLRPADKKELSRLVAAIKKEEENR